jgi:hypothetical protein
MRGVDMIGNRQLKEQIRDLLVGLGSCRTEVAQALHHLGVRAVPQDPKDCAVAVYLRAVLGADLRVESLFVRSRDVKVRTDEPKRFHLPHLVTVALPQPICQFIVAFDEAVYPDLLREEPSHISPRSGCTTGRGYDGMQAA